MKKKQILALLLAFIMCIGLVACKDPGQTAPNPTTEPSTAPTVQTTEPTTDESMQFTEPGTATPLLYRVTDDSGNTVWLFGSIHVGRPDYYALPEYVLNAFDGADSLAVEADIIAFEKDMNLQVQAMLPLVYYDGTTIKDHIPQELYDKAVKILTQYNVYNPAFDMYRPAFWQSLIDSVMVSELGGDVELGIDRHLINRAYGANKEIIEVESAEFQYQLLADFDDEVQVMLLESAVATYENKDEAAEALTEMMDLWASGDENAFAEYLKDSDDTMTEEEKQIYARYEKAMTTDRNLTMTDFAEEALRSGKEVFICVGAAHIVGEGAMAQLLAQRGYTVECITK